MITFRIGHVLKCGDPCYNRFKWDVQEFLSGAGKEC